MKSAQETRRLLLHGEKQRHVTSTKMNAASSRSHLIFSIIVDCVNAEGAQSKGKVSLVDLAGSERIKRSEVTGQAFQEAIAINKSLTVRGQEGGILVYTYKRRQATMPPPRPAPR